MYGSGIEDVNHEVYGGLYAQMIFGESFEEPAPILPVRGWAMYGGEWTAEPTQLRVKPAAGAKLVREAPEVGDGIVAVDVRVDDAQGDNAGLILRVRNPRVGADTWTGYEVSISPRNQAVILGKHQDNWQPLQSVPALIAAGKWYRLRVEMQGPRLRIFLDDATTPVLEYSDTAAPLPAGRVGIRTWQSNASFRNLQITTAAGDTRDEFLPPPEPEEKTVSRLWDPIVTGEAQGRFRLDRTQPFNSLQSQMVEFRGGAGTVGVANRGLNRWGLTFRKGRRYAGRLYLRTGTPGAKVMVALQSGDGTKTYATRSLGPIETDWRRFEFDLRPDATDINARFALWLDRPGKVWVDQVYLSGTGDDLFAGLPIRGDIGRMLKEQGLKMLRYGGLMNNAPGYRWKQMIGDPDRRPQYTGWWYPYTTNGFGIEEFVRFCRAAGFEPVVAINIDETEQDAADLVEYLNGPATSEWGKKRAQNGHPKPYNVRYFEIGNEEGLPGTPDQYRAHYAHYLARFHALHPVMTAKDPSLQLIVAAWWRPDERLIRRMVEELSGKAALWDVHVGGDGLRDGDEVDRTFTQMRKLFQEWSPGTTLKACVLEENGGRHDLQRALGHAHILNTTERHGDFVLMDSPANCLQPWQQNDNGWDQGQVFFTSGQVWGMPPFYAQQMAARNYLPLRVASEVVSPEDDLDVTATRSEDGKTLVLKVVNLGPQPRKTTLQIARLQKVNPTAEVWTLTGRLEERNSPTEPNRIRSQQTKFAGAAETFAYEFPAHSYTILRLRGQTTEGE
jgi:alpha-L-arabinofuranosidase